MTPAFFIRIIDGKIILGDYHRHKQYELDQKHFLRLIELTNGQKLTDSQVDKTLVDFRVLEDPDPIRWGWDSLSRIFHIGTQVRKDGVTGDIPISTRREYLDFCESISHKIPELVVEYPGKIFPLPSPDTSNINKHFLDVLIARKTCRAFNGESVSLLDVATALWLTFGTVHGKSRDDLAELGLKAIGYRRTSPSGGSLHPSEAYLVAMNVTGLSNGIYHYRSHKHELTLVQHEFQPNELGALLCGQDFSNDLAFGVFVTSRFDKMWWKYAHSRAYRVALIDIGCLTQTFQLVCAGLNLQSWPTGYFLDEEINRLLTLDTDIESTMFFLGAGRGDGPVDKVILSIINAEAQP